MAPAELTISRTAANSPAAQPRSSWCPPDDADATPTWRSAVRLAELTDCGGCAASSGPRPGGGVDRARGGGARGVRYAVVKRMSGECELARRSIEEGSRLVADPEAGSPISDLHLVRGESGELRGPSRSCESRLARQTGVSGGGDLARSPGCREGVGQLPLNGSWPAS
jgi:hypothetical protein